MSQYTSPEIGGVVDFTANPNSPYYTGSGLACSKNMMNGCAFPNAENAVQVFIASINYGVEFDTRYVTFYEGSSPGCNFGSSSTVLGTAPCDDKKHSLRIGHVDLWNWYGGISISDWFFTWRQFLEAALATGLWDSTATVSGPGGTTVPHHRNPLFLIDSAKAGLINRDAMHGCNIDYGAVNSNIANVFNDVCKGINGATQDLTACGQWCGTNSNPIACTGSLSETTCTNKPGSLHVCDQTTATSCVPCVV